MYDTDVLNCNNKGSVNPMFDSRHDPELMSTHRLVTVPSVHKKHIELVHLLYSGGERGVKGIKVNNH